MKVLAATLLVLAGCALPESPPYESWSPQLLLSGVKIRSYRGETLVATGRAERLSYERSKSEFVASDTQLRFASKGRSALLSGSEVRAPLLHGTLASHLAEGSGGVTFRTSADVVLVTPNASFDERQKTAFGTTPVRVEGPGYALDARGFVFHFADETFEFSGATTRLEGAR